MTPYMAVTAHWIQSVRTEHVSCPPTEELVLRADLIGFHHLPGHHTGRHIAQLFLYITDRVGVTPQVWMFAICVPSIHALRRIRLAGLRWIMPQIMTALRQFSRPRFTAAIFPLTKFNDESGGSCALFSRRLPQHSVDAFPIL